MHSRIEKISKIIFTVLFLVIVFGPLIQMSVPLFKEFPDPEKRALAPMPALQYPLSFETVKKFKDDYESYFNDHFGFRNLLVKINSLFSVKVLGISPSPDVILGKDGWLFYNSSTDGLSIPDYEGKVLFSPDQLAIIKKNFVLFNAEVKAHGAKLVVMVPPSKHTIYSEYLPDGITKGTLTYMDQVREIMSELNIPLVDPMPALLIGKSVGSIYYKTDTHWNMRGGFIGYQELMKTLTKQFPFLQTYSQSDFVFHENPWVGGDLAGFIDLQKVGLEDWLSVQFKKPDIVSGGMVDSSSQVPYQTVNTSTPYGLTALVYHDSFFQNIEPFFDHSFHKVVYVWSRVPLYGYIDEVHPDIVVFEFTERYAGSLDSVAWGDWNNTQKIVPVQ